MGDSFANHLYPIFIRQDDLKGAGTLQLGACDYFNVGQSNYTLKNHPCLADNYKSQIGYINNVLATKPSIQFVIIAGISKHPDNEYVNKITARLDYLSSLHKQIIIFLPHVKLDYNPELCLSKPLTHTIKDCTADASEWKKISDTYRPIIAQITSKYPNVFFFDPNTAFCDDKKCTFIKDEIPLLRDSPGHFSEYGSEQVGDVFVIWAKKNIPQLLNN